MVPKNKMPLILQIVPTIKFVKTFVEENPLCVCSGEISAVKKLLTSEQDEIKLKQKTSQIVLKLHQDQYFMHLVFTVPDDYPMLQTG